MHWHSFSVRDLVVLSSIHGYRIVLAQPHCQVSPLARLASSAWLDGDKDVKLAQCSTSKCERHHLSPFDTSSIHAGQLCEPEHLNTTNFGNYFFITVLVKNKTKVFKLHGFHFSSTAHCHCALTPFWNSYVLIIFYFNFNYLGEILLIVYLFFYRTDWYICKFVNIQPIIF